MNTARQHLDSCASLCTNCDPDTEETIEHPTAEDLAMGRGCHDEHSCWCPDGGLSYAEWVAKHPVAVKWRVWEAIKWARTRMAKV